MKTTLFIFLGVVIVGIVATLWYKGYLPKFGGSADPVIVAIQEKGTLVVGTDPTYPPMESTNNSGQVVGFDADLAAELASGLGVSLEMKSVPFDNLLDEVATGSVDLAISSFSITPERAKKILFSTPYLNAGQAIIVSTDNTTIGGVEDLKGKRVAAQVDTTSLKEAQGHTDAANVVTYLSDYDDVVAKMKKGTIEAIIMDYPAAANLVQNNPGTKLVGPPFTSEFYGIVAKKENTGLIEFVNNVLIEIKKSGKLSTLESTWLQ